MRRALALLAAALALAACDRAPDEAALSADLAAYVERAYAPGYARLLGRGLRETTAAAGFGMPIGGGTEPAGELTVFLPKRAFRSIFGLLSDIPISWVGRLLRPGKIWPGAGRGRTLPAVTPSRQASRGAS